MQAAYASKRGKLCREDRRVAHDRSPPLFLPIFFLWHIIAILLCMIANSYEFPKERREREWRQRGGGKSKQMAKHRLWPHLQGDLCSPCAGACVGAPRSDRITEPYSCLSVSLSHPNRVPLPGHEGGGEGGRKVNQGSWMYGWQTSLLSQAPVSSMRLWLLGGMGLTLSLCVYNHVGIYLWACVCEMFVS